MYNPTGEEVERAIQKLQDSFGGCYGFPKNDSLLIAIAKGFARIVWDLPISEIPAMKGKEHSVLGNQNDADWIIGEFLERTEKFPSLISIRRIYENSLPPRDGRSSTDIAI